MGVPISVTIRVRRLAGTLRVWIPPPPGDRLWFGFVDEPEVEMDATPSVGQLGIKWHGLAERVSKMITAELLKEVHAALVLPNAGNAFLEPLRPFDDVPEIEVADLVELGKTSYVGENTAPRTRKSEDSPELAVRGPGSPTAAAAAATAPVSDDAAGRIFHTPSNSMLVEDAAAAAIADPSLDPARWPSRPSSSPRRRKRRRRRLSPRWWIRSWSAGSDGRDEDGRRDGDRPEGIGSPSGVGDWTSSTPPPARGRVEVESPPGRRDDDSPILDFHFGQPLARRPSLDVRLSGSNDASTSPGGFRPARAARLGGDFSGRAACPLAGRWRRRIPWRARRRRCVRTWNTFARV